MCRLFRLAQYAEMIFTEQPDRRCVLDFGVEDEWMLYAPFNRSGVYVSDEFSTHEHPECLVRIEEGMLCVGREDMGFDATMKFTMFDEDEAFEPYI